MKKAINALIIREDRKLLLFRKNLIWVLPGGKPEKRESPIETLVRKFKEEASDAEIEVEEYYRSFRERSAHKKDALKTEVYFARLKNPDLKIISSGEIEESRFIGSLDTILIYLSDITSEIIKQLIKERYL